MLPRQIHSQRLRRSSPPPRRSHQHSHHRAARKQTIYHSDGLMAEIVCNANGIHIKQCCASCSHKRSFDYEGSLRKCRLTGKVVDNSDVCDDWVISAEVDKITKKPYR